jgi:hypothetical protein
MVSFATPQYVVIFAHAKNGGHSTVGAGLKEPDENGPVHVPEIVHVAPGSLTSEQMRENV